VLAERFPLLPGRPCLLGSSLAPGLHAVRLTCNHVPTADEIQVAEIVRCAAARGLPLSVRGGGHSLVRIFLSACKRHHMLTCCVPISPFDRAQRALYRLVEDGVMIDMSGMKAVSVDTQLRTARVQGRQPDPRHTCTEFRLINAATGAVGNDARLHNKQQCAACAQAAPYMQTSRQPPRLTSWLCRGVTHSRRVSALHCTAASGDHLTHAVSNGRQCTVVRQAALLPSYLWP